MGTARWLALVCGSAGETTVPLSKRPVCNVPDLVRQINAGKGEATFKMLLLNFL